MDTMEQIQTPIQSDVSEALPLEQQLKGLNRDELVTYLDNLGYQSEEKLTKEAIKENILRIVADRKVQASKVNEESLKQTVSEDDPEIEVRFFNLESSGADLEFAYSEPRGMFGPKNPNGHKKCPKYHLFPGSVTKMAYSVYEHLSKLTFITHKTVWDEKTGMITGTIPIIKPRFILQPIFSKEQILKLNK